MNRVERFRQRRHFRIKCYFIFLISFLLMVAGILATDYSMSTLMNKKSGIGLATIQPYGEHYYEITVLDKKIYFNTEYIKRDLSKIKSWLYR